MTLVLGPGDDILLEVMGDGFTSVDGGGGFNTLNADWSAATTGVDISTGVTGSISAPATSAQFDFVDFSAQNFKTGSGDDSFSWAYTGASVTFSFDGAGGVNTANLNFSAVQGGVSFALDTTPGATSNVFSPSGFSTLKNVQNVILLGSDFNDTLAGGGGDDFLDGRAGHNVLSGGGGDDQFDSEGGIDTIDGGSGFNRWTGDYLGAQPNLTFTQTGSRAYTLSNGTTLANIDWFNLATGSGNDTFNLTSFADGSQINGGAGTNTLKLNLSGSSHGVQASADSGNVLVSDLVTGAQMIATSIQQANFVTGAGDDIFSLWTGNQTANGGAGDDSAIYRGPRSAYSISTAGGVTTVKDLGSGFNDGTDTLTGIEHLKFADQVVNLATTLKASAPSAALVEAGAAGAGVSSSTATLNPLGGSGVAAYVLTGWTAKGGGLYSHAGLYGSAVLDIVHNSLAYTLNNAAAATNALKDGQSVSDGFTVKVSDGATTASASIGFAITGANDNPLAKADQATAHYGSPLLLQASTLLANDADPEGDALAITLIGSAQHGTVSLSGGQVTFTPYVGYVGAAQFSYDLSDGHGGTATGAVAVKVLSAAGTSLGPVSVSVAGASSGQTVDVSGDGQGHQVTGSGFNDVIYGGVLKDTLNGGAGNDLINGGGGADLISGGTGNDTLSGGAGADSFIWAAADVINAPAGTQDALLDFEGAGDGAASGDLLIFNGLSAGSTLTLTSHSAVDPHLYTYTLTNFATGCTEAIVIYSVNGQALTAGDFLFH